MARRSSGGGLLTNEKVDMTVVRIGKAGDPSTIRKLKRAKLKPGFINRVFDTDVDFLRVGPRWGTRVGPHAPTVL